MTGTVVDDRGALVVGANVLLTNEITKQAREFSTSGNGTVIFPDIFPADYDLKVTQAEFKTYVQEGITVGTLEKVDLHTIKLQGGDVATSVYGKAQAARVFTDSSGHSPAVNLKQRH